MAQPELAASTLLLVQIGVIVSCSRLLGLGVERLGQPLVIAEVLAGIVLGPSVLGAIWPGTMAVLFPAASLGALRMLSQVGLVLFMFMVGLELDPKLMAGRARASVLISHVSILLPFALGVGAAFALHGSHLSPGVPFVSFALFLGVAMSVTAFPVLARILGERQLIGSRVGAIALACAAVDDVTAWCLLALVVAVTRAQGLADGLQTALFALLFILVMVFVLRPVLERVLVRRLERRGLDSTLVSFVLLMMLACSAATEQIGIHALFGAFLFGAILPKQRALSARFAEKLETVSVVLLLPLFFAYSGLRTQFGLLSHGVDCLVALLLILIATLGKFGGSTLAARCTGLGWREASAIGILMNTRGLVELIVLNIGLDLGVISPTLFTMLVLMALVTTFATTPMLRWVYPGKTLPGGEASRSSPGVPGPERSPV